MFSLLLKGLNILVFVITVAGAVPCGGPKKSPRTSYIMQIIFYVRSFEISDNILRTQKWYLLRTLPRLHFAISTPFWICAGLLIACID